MNIDHSPQFLCPQHQTHKHAVVHHHAFFFVNEKTFKTGNALLHSLFHFLQDLAAVQVRNAAVHGIVHTGLFFQYLLFGLYKTAYGLTFMLYRIIKNRSDSAAGSRPGSGQITVCRNRAAKGHSHMGMDIQRSRQNQSAGNVFDFLCFQIEILPKSRDFAVFYRHIGFCYSLGSYYGAVFKY